jgi:hypothetical protein
VRAGVWRGPCWPREVIDAAVKQIATHRADLHLYRSHAGLDPKLLKESLEYYDDFFKLVSDPASGSQSADELRPLNIG